VHPNEPLCFECEGPVEVIEDGGTSLTIHCPRCDRWYGVDIGASETGAPIYWPSFRIALSGGLSHDASHAGEPATVPPAAG